MSVIFRRSALTPPKGKYLQISYGTTSYHDINYGSQMDQRVGCYVFNVSDVKRIGAYTPNTNQHGNWTNYELHKGTEIQLKSIVGVNQTTMTYSPELDLSYELLIIPQRGIADSDWAGRVLFTIEAR